MGLYYNRTQSPVPVTLSGGRAILIPAKGREPLTGEDESAPALLAAIKAEKIVRLPDAYSAKVEAKAAPLVSAVTSEVTAPATLEVPAATPVVDAPEVAGLASSIETKNEPAPSDDGSSSPEAAPAASTEQSTRADGPRRERRK